MDSSFRHQGSGLDANLRQEEADPSTDDDRDTFSGIRRRQRPSQQKPASLGSVARAVIAEIAVACQRSAARGRPEMFELSWLDDADRVHVTQTLGLGATSFRIKGHPVISALSTRLPGLWFLEGAGVDRLEIAPLPTAVFEHAFTPTYAALGMAVPRQAGDAEARAVVADLLRRSENYTPAGGAYVADLAQLGLSTADVSLLEAGLGAGSVTLLSRGHGTCMVKSTAIDHVWRVQVLDQHSAVVFDAFEVTRFPSIGQPEVARDTLMANAQHLLWELEMPQ
ncbi:MAG: hydrogenase expression/formation C-terminal domain-containing protein [Pseudomonadota bacterium]